MTWSVLVALTASLAAATATWLWVIERRRKQTLLAAVMVHSGGVLRKLDDLRGLAEALEVRSPDVFLRHPTLLDQLVGADDFLSNLRDRARACGAPSEGVRRLRARAVYVRIHYLTKPSTLVALHRSKS